MGKKLNVGLYGQRGHQIAGILYHYKDAQIGAVCAVSEEYKNEICEKCENEVAVYSTLEEMLRDESLDLISLCSPSRKNQAKEAIE